MILLRQRKKVLNVKNKRWCVLLSDVCIVDNYNKKEFQDSDMS